jgi:hypothetical protein
VCVTTAIAGCGNAAAPQVLHAPAATYLLGADELVSPDFSLDTAPHPVTVSDIAGTDSGAAQQLKAGGFTSAAGEEFFRTGGNLALTNGPLQIRDTVEEFASAAGAAAVYGSDVSRLDAATGAVAVSTGSLGDAAHCTTRTATSSTGDLAVEITVEWRVGNLLDVLVVRGRSGATRPDDALLLAHRQTVMELGLATPAAGGTASPVPSPS